MEDLDFGELFDKKSTIPVKILIDKRLTNSQKLIFGVIFNICKKQGICFLSNDFFSKLLNLSKGTISISIKKLNEANLITTTINYSDKKEILGREIYLP